MVDAETAARAYSTLLLGAWETRSGWRNSSIEDVGKFSLTTSGKDGFNAALYRGDDQASRANLSRLLTLLRARETSAYLDVFHELQPELDSAAAAAGPGAIATYLMTPADRFAWASARSLERGESVRGAKSDSEFQSWFSVFEAVYCQSQEQSEAWREYQAHIGRDEAWTHWGLWKEERIVSVISSFRMTESTFLSSLATPGTFRGNGFASALSRAVIAALEADGVCTFVLQASDMSQGLYQRMGFDTVCTMNIYRLGHI